MHKDGILPDGLPEGLAGKVDLLPELLKKWMAKSIILERKLFIQLEK